MSNLIGQTLDSAEKELKNRIFRIVKIDGKGMMITCDFRPDRLNLEIENNIITRVYEG